MKKITFLKSVLIAVMFFLFYANISNAAGLYCDSVYFSIHSVIPKIKFTKVIKSPIKGLYGVLLTSGRIIYVYPKKNLIFSGQIWNNRGKNLTGMELVNQQESKANNLSILKTFNLNKAIKIGHGPIKVIEFANKYRLFLL